jgi:hypothetical protein
LMSPRSSATRCQAVDQLGNRCHLATGHPKEHTMLPWLRCNECGFDEGRLIGSSEDGGANEVILCIPCALDAGWGDRIAELDEQMATHRGREYERLTGLRARRDELDRLVAERGLTSAETVELAELLEEISLSDRDYERLGAMLETGS